MDTQPHRHPKQRKSGRTRSLLALLGEIAGSPETPTEGVRAASASQRREDRHEKGFGLRRSDWHRKAPSAYTWMRTDKGPQKSWLHHLGKAQDKTCPCGHQVQDGAHLTFHCPRWAQQRRELLGHRRTWEELHNPMWKKEGDEEPYDTIELFFHLLFQGLTG